MRVMPVFDVDQALRSLRALYVIVSHPFDDELAASVARYGRQLADAREAGDPRRAVVVAREAAEWCLRMQWPIAKRLDIALNPDPDKTRKNGR